LEVEVKKAKVGVVAALVTRMQNLSASQRRSHEDQHLHQGSGLAKTSHQWHNLQHFELMVQVEVEVVAALVTRMQNLSASQRRSHEDQHLYQGSGLAKMSHQWHNLQQLELMIDLAKTSHQWHNFQQLGLVVDNGLEGAPALALVNLQRILHCWYQQMVPTLLIVVGARVVGARIVVAAGQRSGELEELGCGNCSTQPQP
jgi:hypothetical protein